MKEPINWIAAGAWIGAFVFALYSGTNLPMSIVCGNLAAVIVFLSGASINLRRATKNRPSP